MSNIIVIGAGRVGSSVANELSVEGHNICCIDKDPTTFANLGSDFNGTVVRGLGFDAETLERAGVKDCDILIACTQSDNANLMACEVAKRLYGVKRVIARLYNPTRLEVYEELGIENICGTRLTADSIIEKVCTGR